MDIKIWEILPAALIFVAGIVAYFEMSLPSPTSLLPPQAVTGGRDAQHELAVNALPGPHSDL
jgi:hypothetical protein